MRSAYIYQGINIMVALLMVPLLLRYLDVSGFILWSIFTTFGGITLQFESAIQMVSVREIAREYHSGNYDKLKKTIARSKMAYSFLSAFILVPFLIIGLLYLNNFANDKLGSHGSTEWIIFIAAYALNYYFGINNSILLGMVQVARYNNINSVTRTINFLGTYLLLKMGFSVLGLCLSFAFSVVIGCFVISRVAKNTLKSFTVTQRVSGREEKNEDAGLTNILKYTLYMVSSFLLYKGGLLIATIIFPKEVIGGYSLTLQAFAMLSMLALVPMQVWLHKLVIAINSGNKQKIFDEFAFNIVVSNMIFIVGGVLLMFFGDTLLVFIGSRVMLTDHVNLIFVFLAFLVELNILLLINFLVIKNNYEFVMIYTVVSFVGIALSVLVIEMTKGGLVLLVAIPFCLQTLFSFSYVLRMVCRELSITPFLFISRLGKFVYMRS